MDAAFDRLQVLSDLEARHDALVRQLDELERRVEATLAECQPPSNRGGRRTDEALDRPEPLRDAA